MSTTLRTRHVVRLTLLAVLAAVVMAPGTALAEDRDPGVRAPGSGGSAWLSGPTRPAPVAVSVPDPEPVAAPVRTPPEVPAAAGGELVPVGRDRGPNVEDGRTVRYRVEVERGLPVPRAGFALLVHQILGDPRGWQGVDGVRFVQVADGEADLTVTLASPGTTDRLCAPLRTRGEVSCWNGSRAVLNAKRWILGAETYGEDLLGYRRYLVAHEVGHGLGHGHVSCPGPGRPAPIMLQQTKSLEGCKPSSWPDPRA